MNSKKIIDKIFTDEKQNREIISLFKAGEINLAKKKNKKNFKRISQRLHYS